MVTPTSIGNTNVGGDTSSTSFSFTTSAAIVSGNVVLIAVGIFNGGNSSFTPVVSSVSDGTNAYAKVFSKQLTTSSLGNRGSYDLEVWGCFNAASVAQNSSVTVNISATMTSSCAIDILGTQFLFPYVQFDNASNSSTGVGNNPSVTGGPWAFNNELLIAISSTQSNPQTPYSSTTGTTWTTLFGYNQPLQLAYANVSGMSAVNAESTAIGTSAYIIAVLGFYQSAPSFPPRRIAYRR